MRLYVFTAGTEHNKVQASGDQVYVNYTEMNHVGIISNAISYFSSPAAVSLISFEFGFKTAIQFTSVSNETSLNVNGIRVGVLLSS